MADIVAISGGSELLYKVSGAVGTPAPLNEAESVGDIAVDYAEINATPLNAKSIRYISGLADGQNVEIMMFDLPDDASQIAIKGAWETRKAVEFTLQPDPDECSTQVRFTLAPNNITRRKGTPADPRRVMLRGRISGPVAEEANART